MRNRLRVRLAESVGLKFPAKFLLVVVDLCSPKRGLSAAQNSALEIPYAECARLHKTNRAPVLPGAANKPSPFFSSVEGRAPSRPIIFGTAPRAVALMRRSFPWPRLWS